MISRCPNREAEPWMRSAIYLWSQWRRFGGLPGPGGLHDQDARLTDAFAILEHERGLIDLALLQDARKKQEASRGR